ncbi:MAG TPA: iron ABC transporter permease [Bacteroidetes bacterium]|nr:iron ABC transporter permease [Bacteroidota bacterium]
MSVSKKRPPLYFVIPAVFIAAGVLLPLVYLVLRASEADWDVSSNLIFRERNFTLLMNTIKLTLGVLITTTLIASPLAWLTVRTDIPHKKWLTLISVMPLAIPGYILAYALLGMGGANGTFFHLFGLEIPRLSGYWGSLVSISLYTYPYMYLNLRSGLLGLDPSVEEAARSLGNPSWRVYSRIVLPQLRPAFLSGVLIIGLYVLGDFGAVSLMRFETFSYALFLQYSASYDRIYAAWLALMLLGLTATILIMEYRLLKGMLFHRSGSGSARKIRLSKLGKLKFPAYGGLAVLLFFAIVIPVTTIFFWSTRSVYGVNWNDLTSTLWMSVSASAPAAIITSLMAVPMAYISIRFPSKISRGLERIAYLGYATPPLALALAFVFFSLNSAPVLYQTLTLLIVAYSLHFLAEAMGPVRSALYQAPPRLEEAARSLGLSPFTAFMRSTFPLLRNGIVAGAALVFLSCMKELPITILLSPIGFETLALNVWSYSNEAMFAEAAPFAIAILLFSSLFVGILFSREWTRS